MNEWAIFLTRLEFAVLLVLEGIQEIRCFYLPDEKEIDVQDMIQTIYELNKAGFIKIDEKNISLADNIKPIMELIKESKSDIRIEPQEDCLYQKICYVSEKIVVLENIQEYGKAFRLFVMEKGDFWQWLETSFHMPEIVVENKKDMAQLLEMNDLVFQEQTKLQTVQYRGAYYDIKEFMAQVEMVLAQSVYAGLRFTDRKSGVVYKDMVIAQGSLNVWFLWCDTERDLFSDKEEIVHIDGDSLEFRQEQLKTFWREK